MCSMVVNLVFLFQGTMFAIMQKEGMWSLPQSTRLDTHALNVLIKHHAHLNIQDYVLSIIMCEIYLQFNYINCRGVSVFWQMYQLPKNHQLRKALYFLGNIIEPFLKNSEKFTKFQQDPMVLWCDSYLNWL